ncbi:hypothetical protein DPEC_G00157860 [Dallia pectoralis]|uniref:Uncharacterized protein n=1 Tax=Dallia pectoralis TaxID=75939 RepID=A0ACC2GL08_DALPE|nr:hypothetical protein DPEC_G00157860 [Dallia pectoralis]
MSVGIESGFSNEEVLNTRFPLHRACRDGDTVALCCLLQSTRSPGDLITEEDSFYGWTPIHWAAHCGKLECVMCLMQAGCEVNTVTTRFAQTPAHIAAFGGHPDCVLWLLQAGADINRQDYVGETPIHKAARAGSMECVNALLIQGAKPENERTKRWRHPNRRNSLELSYETKDISLRNANGLTAADLARAQGFRDCAQLLSNVQNQLNGFHTNGVLNGPLSQSRGLLNGLANRKRLLEGTEPNYMKKARTDGVDLTVWMQPGCEEELETMHMEYAALDAVSDDPKATLILTNSNHEPQNGARTTHCGVLPLLDGTNTTMQSNGFSSSCGLPANQETEETGQHQAHEMCGSLHLTGSPSSCVSHRPAWETMTNDPEDNLHYGHYHGFGDTAEDLAEEHSSSVHREQCYNQAMLGAVHFYHSS